MSDTFSLSSASDATPLSVWPRKLRSDSSAACCFARAFCARYPNGAWPGTCASLPWEAGLLMLLLLLLAVPYPLAWE